MAKFQLNSVRGRIVVVSTLFVAALLGIILYTAAMVEQVSLGASERLSNYEVFRNQAYEELNRSVQGLERDLYRYSLTLDSVQREQLQERLDGLTQRVDAFAEALPAGSRRELAPMLEQIRVTADKLQSEVGELLYILAAADRRFPAIGEIYSRMHPNHERILTALNLAILEANEDGDLTQADRVALLNIWHELRYLWLAQVMETRTYIANRSAVFGEPEITMPRNRANYLVYRERFGSLLGQLQGFEQRDLLGLEQSAALETITALADSSHETFTQMQGVYNSEQWRIDIPFMRSRVDPLFAEFKSINEAMHRIMAEQFSVVADHSVTTATTMVNYLWLVLLLALLLVVAAYQIFERYIYRPVKQVALALDAAGRGESAPQAPQTGVEEVQLLSRAFDNMVLQVNSRQQRLESILDNVSDGIITIDRYGRVETFNKAAERLFGYRAEEMLGENVSRLIPEAMRAAHDGYLDTAANTERRHIIGKEREETARRRDGTLFPMSIKVSELVIDGQHLFTAVVADISERKAAMEKLRVLAEHDSLTGIYNRHYFLEELERAVQRAMRGHQDVVLCYIDLDNFKFVNDTLGHQAGDQLLVEVTDLLRSRVRSGDLFARIGGDEFAILFYDLPSEQTQEVADTFRGLLADYAFKHRGQVVDIGCSIGVARFEPEVSAPEELLARADMACHLAKNGGRNRVHIFDASNQQDRDSMSSEIGWVHLIKQAIEQDRFVLMYQPIIATTSGDVVAHEVLLRMREAQGDGLISPNVFLAAAERFGLINDIDRWVIRHAISQMAKPRDVAVHLNINLSGPTVGDKTLLPYIESLLDEYGVAAERLTFEITETTAITHLATAREVLDGLRQLGCRSALDDFGTGYSSFAYLQELPVDVIKIDGNFVRDVDTNHLNAVMVKAIHDVAHAMGMSSVAEFVESEAVQQRLCDMGIDYLQGYHLGKPQAEFLTAPVR